MAKFYTYNQNNSGGRFIEPALYVIVEANSETVADTIAEDHGLYFDGCDCSCCGDRWNKAWHEDGNDEPKIQGKPLAEYIAKEDFELEKMLGVTIPVIMVVCLNGEIHKYNLQGEKNIDFTN